MQMANETAAAWTAKMKQFAPGFLAGHAVLGPLAAKAVVALYGSTMIGIDDPWSDLDVWVIVPNMALRELRQTSQESFFEFALDSKPGHFTLEPYEGFLEQVRRCDMPLIADLRPAVVLCDPQGCGQGLIDLARQPMRPDVRLAWFRYHYIEMRSEHRACDNPIERGDPAAVLLAMTKALEHAMRAALVLDGQPYPYSKWLARACARTPTGQKVLRSVEELLDLLAADALHRRGPEKGHPLSDKLRDMRRILVGAARAGGLDEPWLDKWWLFMEQADRGAREVTWQD
jgi:hypothetical protein